MSPTVHTYEARFARQQPIRYISHLDMTRAWERMLRRARLPLAYSEGFNPRPRLAFAAPLPVGVLSLADIVEFVLSQPLEPELVLAALQQQAVPGLAIYQVQLVPPGRAALQARMRQATYSVRLPAADLSGLQQAVARLIAADHVPVRVMRQGQMREYDLRPLVLEASVQLDGDPSLQLRLRHDQQATGRPGDILQALGLDAADAEITRTGLILAEA